MPGIFEIPGLSGAQRKWPSSTVLLKILLPVPISSEFGKKCWCSSLVICCLDDERRPNDFLSRGSVSYDFPAK